MDVDQNSADHTSSATARLRAALPDLGGAMRRVAEVLLARPAEAAAGSITWLAQEAAAAPSTVTRLATALGYPGYPALRAAIAVDRGRTQQAGWEEDLGTAIAPDAPVEQVLHILIATELSALRAARGQLDLPTIEALADAMAGARRIHLCGEWGDAISLQELYFRLLRIGRPVWLHSTPSEARIASTLLGPGDVALGLTRDGTNPVVTDFLTRCRANGAATAVITGSAVGPTNDAAEWIIADGTEGGTTWPEFFAGRAADTLVTALLWVLVAQRTKGGLGTVDDRHGAPAADDAHPMIEET